jgi:multidrug transporter EmrE-like cation transporter
MDLLLLVPTIACGVLGTLMLRASQGLRRAGPTALAITCFVLATVGLARLLLVLPVGPVYAVWAGSASLVLLLIDWLVFKEELHRRHVGGMLLIVVGVVLIDLQVHA